MKRFLCAILALVFVVSFAGCSNTATSSSTAPSTAASSAPAPTSGTDADGKAIYIADVPFFTVSAEQVQAFKDTFVKQNCYSDEEIKKLSNATYDEFTKAVYAFSFEERASARGVTIPK